MNSLPKLTIYRPKAWNAVFSKLVKNTRDSIDVEIRDLAVNLGRDYADIKKQSTNNPVILVLPVAHCVSVVKSQKVGFLGVAVKTKNDIFAFRLRSRNPNYLNQVSPKIRIGVPEINITTADISRIVLRKWSTDLYGLTSLGLLKSLTSGPLMEAASDAVSFFCREHIKHVQISDPSERLERLISTQDKNPIDVAIFLGKELTSKNISDAYQDRIIDGANLNHIVCNIYDTTMFPRALYTVFTDDYEKKREEFMIISERISQSIMETPRQSRSKTEPWARIQSLSHPGSFASIQDITTAIKFSEDICEIDHWKTFVHDFPEDASVESRSTHSRSLNLHDFLALPQELLQERSEPFRAGFMIMKQAIENGKISKVYANASRVNQSKIANVVDQTKKKLLEIINYLEKEEILSFPKWKIAEVWNERISGLDDRDFRSKLIVNDSDFTSQFEYWSKL